MFNVARAVHGLELAGLVMLLGLLRVVWLLGGGRWRGERWLAAAFLGLADLMALFGLVRLVLAPPAGVAWLHPLLMLVGLGLLHAGGRRRSRGARQADAGLTVAGYLLFVAGYLLILRVSGLA